MFLVALNYPPDLGAIDAALDEHNAWLAKQYHDGVLIASGPQIPRIGGVLLFGGLTREELDGRLATDPFGQRGLVTYDITRFAATKVAAGLARWREAKPDLRADEQPARPV
jgi:uncharacterized protein YciI